MLISMDAVCNKINDLHIRYFINVSKKITMLKLINMAQHKN